MRERTLRMVTAGFVLFWSGCGSSQGTIQYLQNRDTIYVANTVSNSISAFQEVGTTTGNDTFLQVLGSPFELSELPTSLAGDGIRGAYFVVASRSAKAISGFRVDTKSGSLSPLFAVSTAHQPMGVAEWQNFVYVANFEESVSAYAVGSDNSVKEVPGSPFPAGAGPAALAVAGTMTRNAVAALYVANSLSNDVSGFLIDGATGALTPFPGSPYQAGNAPAWIDVEPPFYPNPVGGPTLVFVANTGSNDVSVFSIAASGDLGAVPGSPFLAGQGPSSIGIGNAAPLKYVYVGNSRSNNISGFAIDPNTGSMTALPGSPFISGSNPSSLAVSPGRRLLFAANAGSNNLFVFRIDDSTGALIPLSGSPFLVGQSPQAVLYYQAPQ